MTSTEPLTQAEHVTAAAMFLARSYDRTVGKNNEAADVARAQVHATLALIPGAGAVPARPAPAPATPARVPKVLTFEDVAGAPWTLEVGLDGYTAVLADAEGTIAVLILDDPDVIEKLADALQHHARRIRDEHPPRKDATP